MIVLFERILRVFALTAGVMIPISKAIAIIEKQTRPLGIERVNLAESVGRILAQDIVADTDLPPFDRSQMDGFAVKAKDTENAPITLKMVGESAAGKGWHHKLKKGETVRIMTGAPVPAGADAVQRVEVTTENGQEVEILEPTKKGKFIVPLGAEVRRGDTVIPKREIITANMIATLAAFGFSEVKLSQMPKVGILGTGSEIVEINEKPGQDQIRNSNSLMLKTFAEKCGARADILPVVRDDIGNLGSAIKDASRESDILVITGGVSVGKYDFTKAALRELGAEIFFERVRLKPGKPTVFARLGTTLIFGLPGNPVSAAVTFYLFVRTAILKMQNAKSIELRKGFAVLKEHAKGNKERDSCLPARLETDKKGRLVAKPLRWHGSSDFIGFAGAEALIFVPNGRDLEADEVAEIAFLH